MSQPLHGREHELQTLTRLLAQHGKVLITGTPGVGKSSLALAYLEAYNPHYQAHHVNCSEIKQIDQLEARLAGQLHIDLSASQAREQLGHALHARHIEMLILDDIDGIIDEVIAWFDDVHTHHQELSMLATSQCEDARFDHVYTCPPLDITHPEGSATQLFTQLLPEQTRHHHTPEELHHVVLHTDGLPLCIEICAPLFELVGGAVLAKALQEDPHLSERLTKSIEIAWSNLTEGAQQTLMALSLCTGQCDIHVLAAILERPVSSLPPDLTQLRQHSLIRSTRDHHTIYYSLLESIKRFTRSRHRTHPSYQAHLDRFHAHLHAQAGFHAQQLYLHHARDSHDFLTRHHTDLLQLDSLPTPTPAGIHAGMFCLTYLFGGNVEVPDYPLRDWYARPMDDHERGLACLSTLLYCFLKLQYEGRAKVLDLLGELTHMMNHETPQHPWALYLRAEYLYQRNLIAPQPHEQTSLADVLELSKHLNTQTFQTLIAYQETLVRTDQLHLDTSQELAQFSVRFEQLDMPRFAANAIAQTSIACIHLNHHARALTHLNTAIEYAKTHHLNRLLRQSLSLRAMITQDPDMEEQSLEDMNQALHLSRLQSDYKSEANTHTLLLSFLAQRHRYKEAYAHGTRALAIYRAIQSGYMPRQIELVLILCALLMEERSEASDRLRSYQPEVTQDVIDEMLERTDIICILNMLSDDEHLQKQGHQAPSHPTQTAITTHIQRLMRSDAPPFAHQLGDLGKSLHDTELDLEDRLILRIWWQTLEDDDAFCILKSYHDTPVLCLRHAPQGQLEDVSLLANVPAWTSIKKRPVMQALLHTLLAHHHTHPGQPLPSLELAEKIWPDDMMTPEALTNRLYNVMAQWRRLGFGDTVASSREGYWLLPSLTILERPECPI